VACYQNHLSSGDCTISNPDTSAEILKDVQLYPTEDTIPSEKLNLLCMYDLTWYEYNILVMSGLLIFWDI